MLKAGASGCSEPALRSGLALGTVHSVAQQHLVALLRRQGQWADDRVILPG